MKTPLHFLKSAAVNFFQILAATLIFLFLFEGIFILAGFPQGAARFTEIVVLKNGLSVHKPRNEFRIFTYGESTMHGSHYWPASNPARWLEADLKDFLPQKPAKVVNFARMGQGSDFIYTSFRDTAAYKPDLAIFYMGHNAFLYGNRKDQALERKKGASIFFKELLRRSRLISFVSRVVINARIRTKKEKPEDRIDLDKIESDVAWAGLNGLTEINSPLYTETVEYYKANLIRILELAKKRKIPVIFFMPVGNLKDFSPYCSVHLKDLEESALSSWRESYEQGIAKQSEGDWDGALQAYSAAYQIDSSFSALAFRMGEVELQKGNYPRAGELFKQARDLDCVPVRTQKAITDVLAELSKKYGFPLISPEKILAPEVLGGIMGEPIIEDNVHFSIKGHALVARALVEEIADKGWIAPRSEWHFEKERPFEEVKKELGVTDDLLFQAYMKNVYYLGSRFKMRLLFAEKAMAIHPEDPFALRHLAWSYWLMKDQSKALEVYRKLQTLHPEALQEVFQNQPSVKEAFLKAFPAAKAA